MKVSHSCFALTVAVTMVTAQYVEDFCKTRMEDIKNSHDQGSSPMFYDNFYVFSEIKSFVKSIVYEDIYYSEQAQQMYSVDRSQASKVQTWINALNNEMTVAESTNTTTCVDSALSGSLTAQFMDIQVDAQGRPLLNPPEVVFGWNKKFQTQTKYVGASAERDPHFSFSVPVIINFTKPVLPVVAIIESVTPENENFSRNRIDFSFYDSVQPNGPVFQVPATLLCQSTPSPQLPSVPSSFKYRGEQITIFSPNMRLPNPVSFLYSNAAYMYDLKLFIQDYMSTPSTEGNDKSYWQTVDDFNVGLNFEIDLITGECKVQSIMSQTSDAVYVSDGIVQMRTPQQFFDLDSSKYQYKGIFSLKNASKDLTTLYGICVFTVTKCEPKYENPHNNRGIDCDVWSAYFDDGQYDHEQNTLYTWYFANPQWMKNFGFQNWTVPLPVSLEIEQEGTFMYLNYYEFDTQDTVTIPDLSFCFDPSNTMNIEFFLSVEYDKVVTSNYGNFFRAIPVGLILQTSLNSLLRISQLDIQPADSNETVIRFKLLDIGSLPVQGDVSSALLMAPNSQVYKDLEKGINSGTFSFDIQLPAGSEKSNLTVYARPNSLGLYSDGKFVSDRGSSSATVTSTTSTPRLSSTTTMRSSTFSIATSAASTRPSSPTSSTVKRSSTFQTGTPAATKSPAGEPESGSSSLSSGALAGIIISMVILGVVIGVVVFYILRRFRESRDEDNGAMDMKPLSHE